MSSYECEQLVLARCALGAHFGKARRDHTDRLDPGGEGGLDSGDYLSSRNTDDREIDWRRHIGDRHVAADAADGLASTVDGIGSATEVSLENVAKELAA